MFHTFAFCCLCCCRLIGVFAGTDELKSVSVMEGDSVSLNSSLTEIPDGDVILWTFGTNRSLIAKTDGVNNMIPDNLDERFRDRLKLDKKTGSLTIMNIRPDHAGVYEVKISSSSLDTKHRFTVTVYGVFAGTDELKSVSVKEGDSVTLNSSLTEIQKDEDILWTFGTNGPLIAKTDGVNTIIHDVLDGRFRDRLKLDKKTGSLTIMNIRTDHAGVYEVKISNSSLDTTYRFTVTVYARLPIPVISSNSSDCSSPSGSSVSRCVLLCSVVNVSHVTLSWYKGNSVLSSISVSDLSISLSLPLEIECLDDSYSCVVASSFTNWTTHLNTELCQTCPDCVFCCHVSEAVTRLVISALVGVAAACIVVYDITSRKQERT